MRRWKLRWISDDGQNVVIQTTVGGGYAVGWRFPSAARFHAGRRLLADGVASDGTAAAGIYGLAAGVAFFSGPQSLHVLAGVPVGPGASHGANRGGGWRVGRGGLEAANGDSMYWYWTPAIGTVPLSRVINSLPPNLAIEEILAMSDDVQHILGSATTR